MDVIDSPQFFYHTNATNPVDGKGNGGCAILAKSRVIRFILGKSG